MNPIEAAWPRRELRLAPPRTGPLPMILAAIGLLLFAGMGVASAVYTFPDLLADWRIAPHAVPVEDGHVVAGSCHSKLFINICDTSLTAPGPDGTTVRRDMSFAFADLHLGDYTVRVLADPAQPALLTTDLAIDNLWSRTITLGAFWLLLLLLVWGGVRGWRQRAGRRAILRGAHRFRPVAVGLKQVPAGRRRVNWTASVPGVGAATWLRRRGDTPFLLPDGSALGVLAEGSRVPFPLDAGLTWIDLSERERDALRAAGRQPVAA